MSTGSLYKMCGDLFTGCPLAVETSPDGSFRSMVLTRDDGDGGFFVLMRDDDEGQPFYSISRWRAPGGVDIGADTDAAIPELFADAIAHGAPIPRHGSLFGWHDGRTITALIAIYAQYTPATPEPSWATMLLAGIPEPRWPKFVTGERAFGHWFWEAYRDRNFVSLADLIAANPGVVFWVDTVAILGSGCCVVKHDIGSPDGPILRRGRYVYYQALQEHKPVPSLETLLADTGRIDLAARFGCGQGGN
jgi:hypothetical protein